MNVRDAIAEAVKVLANEPIGSPRMAAEALLQFTLGRDRAFLYAHPEHELTPAEQQAFDAAVAARASGKPLQYITGHQEFWGLDFLVTPSVLIPRPETEHLVEAALELAQDSAGSAAGSGAMIVDVGTGSGCIALALASALPKAEVHATDISPDALDVARENARRLALENRVTFHSSDLLAGLPASHFDLVVSNPPYVGRCEKDKVQREVRDHEPALAVFAGASGLDIYRRLIPQARAALKPGGWLLLEIGYSIEKQVCELLKDWIEVRAIPDLQGIPRVIVARKPFR